MSKDIVSVHYSFTESNCSTTVGRSVSTQCTSTGFKTDPCGTLMVIDRTPDRKVLVVPLIDELKSTTIVCDIYVKMVMVGGSRNSSYEFNPYRTVLKLMVS